MLLAKSFVLMILVKFRGVKLTTLGKTLNTKQIISGMAATSDLKIADIEPIVNRFIEVMVLALSMEEDVILTHFGRFVVKRHAAKVGHNPTTLEPVDIPERNSIKFRPFGNLKVKVNGFH